MSPASAWIWLVGESGGNIATQYEGEMPFALSTYNIWRVWVWYVVHVFAFIKPEHDSDTYASGNIPPTRQRVMIYSMTTTETRRHHFTVGNNNNNNNGRLTVCFKWETKTIKLRKKMYFILLQRHSDSTMNINEKIISPQSEWKCCGCECADNQCQWQSHFVALVLFTFALSMASVTGTIHAIWSEHNEIMKYLHSIDTTLRASK